MLLGVLADVCQEVFWVSGVTVPVLVTCLIAVSKYLGSKGKEVFAMAYSFRVYSSLCREIGMKECEETGYMSPQSGSIELDTSS